MGWNVELSLFCFSALGVEGFASWFLLILVEDIESHEFDSMIEVSVIIMLTIWLYALNDLGQAVELLIRVLISCLQVMLLIAKGILDSTIFIEYSLENKLAGKSVPKWSHIKAIYGDKHVLDLLPQQVFIVKAWIFELQCTLFKQTHMNIFDTPICKQEENLLLIWRQDRCIIFLLLPWSMIFNLARGDTFDKKG